MVVIIVKGIFIAVFIATETFGLGPDEAQYWTWSKDLALGYYSKPPGIAWQIALSTFFFGDSEFGVRASSLIMGSLIPLATFRLAKACSLEPKTCFLAAAAFALSPVGILSTVLAITDVGMVLFWTLAVAEICQALSNSKLQPYYRIGFYILFGAIFKWPSFLLWALIVPLLIVNRRLYNKHLYGGIAISLMALLPTIFWNMQNDWSTFKHVFSTIHNSNTAVQTAIFKGNFWEFIGMQALLMFPTAFILLCFSLKVFYKEKHSIPTALVFCGISTLAVVTIYAILAIVKKIQGNWCDFVYPQAFVLLAWGCCEKLPHLRGKLTASTLCSATTILALPFFAGNFKHNSGWKNLTSELSDAGYNPQEHFLFSDKYQTSSILSFYGPDQKRAYFLNVHNIRNNQFSFWPGMDSEQQGKTGFFVYIENAHNLSNTNIETTPTIYQELLEKYFSTIEFIGMRPLQKNKAAMIFKCSEYNGAMPDKSSLW